MKAFILGLLLFGLVYSDDMDGWVLQPDGSYLQTIEEPSTDVAANAEDGWVLQPDGSYLKTINQEENVLQEENMVQDEDDPEYKPQFNHNYFTIGKGKNMGTFKITQGDANNEYDYSVQPVESVQNPVPVSSDEKDAPQVYDDGTQGQPDYKTVIGVGKGNNRIYLRMKPDSSKPSGYKFIPQYISGYTKVPGKEMPNATEEPVDEDDEEDEKDIPEDPDVQNKKGYSVICIGKPNRRYVKVTPGSNPFDFKLNPIKSPNQPNTPPDDDDDEAPEIVENGTRGQPDYAPVIACGPSDNRRYISVVPNPKKPNKFKFRTVHRELEPGEATTEPNEDDVEFEDVPEDPKYKVITVPGRKMPYHIISVGPPRHRAHFKVVYRSKKPGDVEVTPILDPDHPDSPPKANNDYAPEVVQPGDPSNPNNCPIIATGPRFKRVFHRLLIINKRVKFIPVKRRRDAGKKRYVYVVRTRRWHPRIRRKRIIKKIHHRPIRFTKRVIRTVTTRTTNRCGGFLSNLFGGGCKNNAGTQVMKMKNGKRYITTQTVTRDRGFHPTRPKTMTNSQGGFLGGLFG